MHLPQIYAFFALLLLKCYGVCSQIVTSDQIVREGDKDVVMPCDYSGFTVTAYSIEWGKLDENGETTFGLVNDRKNKNGRYSLMLSPGNADLVISNPSRNDSKIGFKCRIQTIDGEIDFSNVVTLTVYYLETPTLYSPSSIVNEGEPVTFNCSIPDGDPTPINILWYKDGEQIQTKESSRYKATDTTIASYLMIESSTKDDKGWYKCKAESDQFKGDDSKVSANHQITINYIDVKFVQNNNEAKCSAEGHPIPQYTEIAKDGKLASAGETSTTLQVDEEVCKSKLTCFAFNGRDNVTKELEKCEAEVYGLQVLPIVIVVVCIILVFVWIILLIYYILYKKIEWASADVEAIEGKEALINMNYRPSIAYFKSFKFYKVGDANETQFNNNQSFFKYILYGCVYFCGICCYEYKDKSYGTTKTKQTSNGDEIELKRSRGDGEEQETLLKKQPQKPPENKNELETTDEKEKQPQLHEQLSPENKDEAKTIVEKENKTELSKGSQEKDKLLSEGADSAQEDSSKERKRNSSYNSEEPKCICSAKGRGKIEVKIKSLSELDEGAYRCNIEGSRQKNLCVTMLKFQSMKMLKGSYNATEHSCFEMKCKYKGKSDFKTESYKWQKLGKDNNIDIDDLSKDPNFEVTQDDNSFLSIKIKKVRLSDAGKYQCMVDTNVGHLECSTELKVTEKEFLRLKVQSPTTEGIDNFELIANIFIKEKSLLSNISDVIWYKESEEKEEMISSLMKSDEDSKYQTKFKEEDSKACLRIKNVKSSDAGLYKCVVALEIDGKFRTYKSKSGILGVEDPVFNFENMKTSVSGENSKIFYKLFPSAPKFIRFTFYKSCAGKWDKVADSDTKYKWKTRFEAHHNSDKKEGYLVIRKVNTSDSGLYRCQFITETKDVSYSAQCQLKVSDKEYITLHEQYACEGDNAHFACSYYVEKELNEINWYKKGSGKTQLISQYKSYQTENKKSESNGKYLTTFFDNASRLEITNVTVEDAGIYICELVKTGFIKKEWKTSASLHVPWNVFTSLAEEGKTSTVHRYPAVVFVNDTFCVFCESNSDVLLKRGIMTGKNSIEWKKPRAILKENNASFHSAVPIVVNTENGHVLLLCIKATNKSKKVIQMKSDDNGKTWKEHHEVHLDFTNICKKSSNFSFFIGPGHGVCTNSKTLLIAGVINQNKNRLFVLRSDDLGSNWECLPAPGPDNAFLGKHSQIVEYANDQVCISCSLAGTEQRYHVYSSDGCKTFHKLEPALIEPNPGCQAGITSLPMKKGLNLTALTNPSSKTKFENLTLHLSDDGCKTWNQICQLGARYSKNSDLAYYEIDDGKEKASGIACVFENGDSEDNYSIVMQLINKEQLMNK